LAFSMTVLFFFLSDPELIISLEVFKNSLSRNTNLLSFSFYYSLFSFPYNDALIVR
jgi:hypothetical protein